MAKKTSNVTAIEKKAAPGALADWEKEALEESKKDAAKFAAGMSRISTKGGVFTIDGNKIGEQLTVAVIDAVFGKAYFPKAYNPKAPAQTPTCYGFSPESFKVITPHAASPSPECDACKDCEHDAFGTALQGNGKRCKDEIRLMVVAPDEDFDGAEVRMLSISPSSIKHWGKYVAKLADMGGTFKTVFTEITLEEEGEYSKMVFHPAGKLSKEQYFALKARRESAVQQAMQPWPDLKEEKPAKAANPEAAAKRNRKVS